MREKNRGKLIMTDKEKISNIYDKPDPSQGHPARKEWPSTPYSDEARAEEPSIETSCCIAFFGGCTLSCGNWPPAMRPENQLTVRLRRAFSNQLFLVRNFGVAGETAGDFLKSNQLDKIRENLSRIDIAFLRYGIADRKSDGVPRCIENISKLCRRWVDYPKHYMWDRNARLAPLYQQMRKFAEKEGYPLIDIFSNIEKEAQKGNWDLRVRGIPDPKYTINDDSFDEFYKDDPAFFTNIHPNSRCFGLIAEWEIKKLKELFGDRLPNPNRP
jgi:acyl-CoA thioesterase-1